MTALELYREATIRGLRLSRVGDRLAVMPKGKFSPDFAMERSKRKALKWLERIRKGDAEEELPLDNLPRLVSAWGDAVSAGSEAHELDKKSEEQPVVIVGELGQALELERQLPIEIQPVPPSKALPE